MPSSRASLSILIWLGACGGTPVPLDGANDDDAGEPYVRDAMPGVDGGVDANLVATPDASERDAWREDAARAPTDAALDDVGPPVLHDCRDFEDRSAADADRTVVFGGAATYAYEPACMRIAPGQSVTFSGRFTHHPLAPGRSPLRPLDPPGASDTPMVAVEEGMSATVIFSGAGDYPYHCPVHDHLGMWGVVRVE